VKTSWELHVCILSLSQYCLSLHRAGHQSSYEIAAGEHIDNECRDGRKQSAGKVHIVLFDSSGRADQIVQCHRHRLRKGITKRYTEQKIVPDIGGLPDNRNHDNRSGVGQYNVCEYFHEMSAINLGRLNNFVRKIGISVAEKEGGKSQCHKQCVPGSVLLLYRPA